MSFSRRHRVLRLAAGVLLAAVTALGSTVTAAAQNTDTTTPPTKSRSSELTPVTPGGTITATERALRCARAATDAGWRGSTLVTAVAVSLAESWCTPTARASNPPSSDCPNGSLDRGAWQINNCYHTWVTDSCAYEVYCNARAAYSIYGWSGWNAWTVYRTGAYRSYLGEAQAAVDELGGGGGGVPATVNTGSSGDALNVRSGPASSYSVVGSLANGTRITITCQTRGEWIYSDVYGIWTNLWDRIGTGRYVSDAFVNTGSDGQVAPSC